MNLNSPAVMGFLKGLGAALVGVILLYFSDAAHFQGLLSPAVAVLIAAIAQGLHDHIEGKTGKVAFGAIKRS